jgi:hypothetical protein
MKTLAVVVLSTVAVLAQAGSDYSGTWRLDREASSRTLAGSGGPEITWVVRHERDVVVVEVRTNGSLAAMLEKRLDGSLFEQSSQDGSRTTLRAAWRGADLVFSGTRTTPSGTTTDVTETWQRLGDTLTVTTIFKAPGGTEFRSLKVLHKVQ